MGGQQIVPVKGQSALRNATSCRRRSTYDTQDWKGKETTHGIASEGGGQLGTQFPFITIPT